MLSTQLSYLIVNSLDAEPSL